MLKDNNDYLDKLERAIYNELCNKGLLVQLPDDDAQHYNGECIRVTSIDGNNYTSVRRWDPVVIPDGVQLFKSTCDPLPPGTDVRESAFSLETRNLTRDEMVALGFLAAKPDETPE